MEFMNGLWNNLRLKKKAADIYLAGGQVFDGTLVLNGIIGTNSNPVKISSWGIGRALINVGKSEAIKVENCKNLLISNLDIKGNGRKGGNVSNGLALKRALSCMVEQVKAEGFQKSGVDLKSIFDIDLPLTDFYGNPVPQGDATEPGIHEIK